MTLAGRLLNLKWAYAEWPPKETIHLDQVMTRILSAVGSLLDDPTVRTATKEEPVIDKNAWVPEEKMGRIRQPEGPTTGRFAVQAGTNGPNCRCERLGTLDNGVMWEYEIKSECPIHGEGRMSWHKTPVAEETPRLSMEPEKEYDGPPVVEMHPQIRGVEYTAGADREMSLGAYYTFPVCVNCSSPFTTVRHDPNIPCTEWNRLRGDERVNHPAHYGGAADPYEHIKVADAWGLNYRLGNCTKYICRSGRKPGVDGLEDLKKALWYLQSEVDRLESERKENKS